MTRDYFEKMSIYKQGDVSILVNSTIETMVKEQFNLTQVVMFTALLQERLGQLDVVPTSMVESRHCVCGSAETDPQPEETTSLEEMEKRQAALNYQED